MGRCVCLCVWGGVSSGVGVIPRQGEKSREEHRRGEGHEVNYSALLIRPALDEHQQSLSLYINESHLTVTSS